MLKLRIAVMALVWVLLPVAQAQTGSGDTAELLRSARLWEASGRYDLALQSLEKYRLEHADDPRASLRIGLLDVRNDQLGHAADVVADMEHRFPGTFELEQMRLAQRMATTERQRMAGVRRLIEIRDGERARAELEALFPGGAPGFDLGLDYFRAVALTTDGWKPARQGLAVLVQQDPDNPRYQLELARHLLRSTEAYADGMQALAALAQRQDVTTDEAAALLREALLQRSLGLVSPAMLQDFAARHPDDKALAARVEQGQRLERNRRFLAPPDLGAVADDAMRQRLAEHHRQLDLHLRGFDGSGLPDAAQTLATAVATGDAPPAWQTAQKRPRGRDAGTDTDTRRAIQKLREQALGLYWHWRAVILEGRAQWVAADALLEAAAIVRDDRLYAAADALERLGQADSAAAEGAYREALEIDRASAPMLRGLSALLSAQNRHDEALKLAREFRGDAADGKLVQAAVLRARAGGDIAANRSGSALRDLEAALQLAPDDAWIRYDLARLYRQLGLSPRGRELMEQGAARAPRDADMRYAQALYLSLLDEPRAALVALEAVPVDLRSAKMRATVDEMRLAAMLQDAGVQHASGRGAEAERTLQQAQALAGDDPARLNAVADLWLRFGQSERAYALLEQASAGVQTDADLALRLAELYLQARDGARLEAQLTAIAQREKLAPAQRTRLAELRVKADLLAAESLRDSGRSDQALARVERIADPAAESRRVRELKAELLVGRGRAKEAVPVYEALFNEAPDDVDLRFGYAKALMESGARDAAARQLDMLEARIGPDESDRRQLLFWRRYGIDDYAGAQRVIDAQLQRHPDDADVVAGAAELARARGQSAQASTYFRRAAQLLRERNLGSDRARADAMLAQVERFGAAHRGWVAGGVNLLHKPGSAGISQLDAVEVPVELRVSLGERSHWFAQAERVDLSAGTLPADYDAAGEFGTVYAAGPAAIDAFPGGYRVEDQGTAIGVGYQSDALRVDLGTTPLGFAVEDVVGGLELYADAGRVDIGLDVSRRPLTSSLLSYAGIEDPVSGRTWGGVRASGAGLRAGRYEENYSLSASAERRWLQGRNVRDNRYTGLRVAGDRRLFGGEQWTLFAGLTANYWHYSENLRHYSFGHGGYYSPQRYVSLSLPLDLRGRWSQLSYLLRVAATYSASREDAALVYPDDPDLQAAAAAQPPPGNFDAPVYGGGRSDGIGVAARGALEYALSRHWFVGVRAELDRSDYYEPESYGLYFRREFRDRSQPELPPRPPVPYSEF
ncbi:MAG: cellulose synthase subunit BcsC-related outer membrane protein [Sinimarinibacterium sp.]